jgi:hypothetical protein
MVLLKRQYREKGCFDGRWTSRHRFGDGSKQVVFLLKLLAKFLKKGSNIKVTDPAMSF